MWVKQSIDIDIEIKLYQINVVNNCKLITSYPSQLHSLLSNNTATFQYTSNTKRIHSRDQRCNLHIAHPLGAQAANCSKGLPI